MVLRDLGGGLWGARWRVGDLKDAHAACPRQPSACREHVWGTVSHCAKTRAGENGVGGGGYFFTEERNESEETGAMRPIRSALLPASRSLHACDLWLPSTERRLVTQVSSRAILIARRDTAIM